MFPEIMIIGFWASFGLLAYTWIGYPILLRLFALFVSERPYALEYIPVVTVLLTVRNEEKVIAGRLDNLLEADYPAEKYSVLVASDGSTDMTDEIVARYGRENSRIILFRGSGGGKSATQNQAMPLAEGEIIVLTDAGTRFERGTLRALVRSFAQDDTGCVSGRLVLAGGDGTVAESQGFYWSYELMLRRFESRLGWLHTASGVVMAFRRALFRPFDPQYGDDCMIPLDILEQCYRVLHEDDAIAYDAFPSSPGGELRARIRMTLRNFSGTLSRPGLLNPFRHPLVAHAIFFHKLARWMTPYFLAALLLSNILILGTGEDLYIYAVVAQSAFYFMGLLGLLAQVAGRRIPGCSHIFNFLLANAGFGLGVYKALRGEGIRSYRNV